MFKKDNNVKLIAEIGGNHEGDFDYALELLDLALDAKVDSIKFQIYSGESLVNEKVDKERSILIDLPSLQINTRKSLIFVLVTMLTLVHLFGMNLSLKNSIIISPFLK